ncbi:Csu type fimbrial protein [Cupriavidus pauculus]|uniref:Csu type fimbrial protein n=1 Tax=Cupriavidus pauculus TaxID=82633 RepID=UPI00147938CE|nr:spore coat protein U domain-containing protein [Cupriavidus pauculus]MCM3605415.1 spore coat U domain-containing protein [Cupriavidus pauculus]UAL02701.1 spore coat U domain-containing protein [Cupriavidus pauculus]
MIRMALAFVLALAGWTQPAWAVCTATAPSVAFGSYSPVSGNSGDVQGVITVTCTGVAVSARVRACINIGTGSGGTSVSPRTLANGASTLNFNIYTDSARTQPWGSRSTGTAAPPVMLDFAALLGNGSASASYYAQLPASQTAATVGAYTSQFTGLNAEVTYIEYLLLPPDCSQLSSPSIPMTFTASANVISDCNISATPLDFGAVGLLAGNHDATSTLTVQCTQGAPYSIALNAGVGSGATVAARRMTRSGGTQMVAYQLFSDANRTQPWGDGTQGTTAVSGTGNGVARTITVYGRVPGQTTPQAGSYADTVTATITY